MRHSIILMTLSLTLLPLSAALADDAFRVSDGLQVFIGLKPTAVTQSTTDPVSAVRSI